MKWLSLWITVANPSTTFLSGKDCWPYDFEAVIVGNFRAIEKPRKYGAVFIGIKQRETVDITSKAIESL